MKAPRTNELRQVGGRSCLGAGRRFERAWAFASSRERGRLRRALVSIRPPCVPRRLRCRFFLV
jgi:hypothetical protein